MRRDRQIGRCAGREETRLTKESSLSGTDDHSIVPRQVIEHSGTSGCVSRLHMLRRIVNEEKHNDVFFSWCTVTIRSA